jgi:hypothetical protein
LPADAVVSEAAEHQTRASVSILPPALACNYAVRPDASSEIARMIVKHDLGLGWVVASGVLAAGGLVTYGVLVLRGRRTVLP